MYRWPAGILPTGKKHHSSHSYIVPFYPSADSAHLFGLLEKVRHHKKAKKKKKNVEILFSNKEKEETISDGIDQTVGLELISIDSKMILLLIKEKRMTQLFYPHICGFLSPLLGEKYKKKITKKGKKYTTHELLDYVRFSETKENKNGLIHRTPGKKKKKKKREMWHMARERRPCTHRQEKKSPRNCFPGV